MALAAQVSSYQTNLPVTQIRVSPKRVLVRRLPPTRELGGILLADTALRDNILADVIAAGAGTTIEAGERVVVHQHSGFEVKALDQAGDVQEFFFVETEDVLAVMDEYGQLRGVQDHLILAPEIQDDRSAGGIIIPDIAQQPHQTFSLISNGCVDPAYAWIPEGGRVLVSPFAGVQMRIAGVNYVIIRPGDCLGVVKSEPGATS